MSSSTDFIRTIINEHLRTNKYGGKVVTRFPPEPNGYLHIGHAKSICLNFGLAQEYQGTCHLRFDDTDPAKEEAVFEEAIKEAVSWLGFSWGENLYHASDYFDRLYELAVELIKMGKAYVCSQTLEEIREFRGTVTEAGRPSPYRERSVEENLDLFHRMKAGEFQDGEHVLRAKIDMASPNMKMRDPLLYRIRHVSHHMTGDKWCLYPLYDFTHCLSDSIEGITHSICTLEFENNRELYDWIIETLDMPDKPRQYEFARLNINYTVMSKRKILELVNGGHVMGWDDPRLLTLAGLRRRGYTAESIRHFCASVGVAKANSVVDMAQLEFAIRNDLNTKAPRVLAVLNPLKVVITNYPEGKREAIQAPYFPEEIPREESRELPFSREIYIEQEDFMENPPKGYHRLSPGKEVRLRYAYTIRCDEVVRDATGQIVELRCSYDEATPIGESPSDGRRVKGIIHWLSAAEALSVEVRAYDRLFTVENPGSGEHEAYLDYVNPDSLIAYPNAWVEPSVKGAEKETHFQFQRHGYFVTDREESSSEKLVFNRTVTLKDSWEKKKKASLPKREVEVKETQKPPKPQPKVEVVLTPSQKQAAQKYEEMGLSEDYAVILALQPDLAEYFDRAYTEKVSAPALANWVINDLQRVLKEQGVANLLVSPENLADLVKQIEEGVISTKIGKEVFAEMSEKGVSASSVIEKRGLKQISNVEELSVWVDEVLSLHPDVVEQIRGGRTNRKGFLVGKVMQKTQGKANPKLLSQILDEKLAH